MIAPSMSAIETSATMAMRRQPAKRGRADDRIVLRLGRLRHLEVPQQLGDVARGGRRARRGR
jgi:hypothetical protein